MVSARSSSKPLQSACSSNPSPLKKMTGIFPTIQDILCGIKMRFIIGEQQSLELCHCWIRYLVFRGSSVAKSRSEMGLYDTNTLLGEAAELRLSSAAKKSDKVSSSVTWTMSSNTTSEIDRTSMSELETGRQEA